MTVASRGRELFKLVLLLMSFSSILASGYDYQSECDSPLAASVPDNRWTASSTLDPIKFGPHLARLSNTVETVGWCSPSSKEKKKRPFIQLDLGQNMRITALSTAGVLIKSQSTGNYSFMYASQYFLSYKREDDKAWRRYHKNDVSVTLIKVNSSESHKQELLTPRIARYIRLVIVDVVGENLCLKMEVHGCPWTKHDGLISYKISQGNVRAAGKRGWSFLRDKGYDGNRLAFGTKLGLLYNGLGQLSDGVTGNLADWNDTGNPDWIKWIGWKDSLTPDPTITFHFSALRRFSSVRFHILNLPGQHEKMLFSKVILSFSKDGEYFAWKTIYEPSITKRTSMCNRAFWIEVNLEGHVGKDVTCDFQYYGWWVLISEVEFESVEISRDDGVLENSSIAPLTTSNKVVTVLVNTTDEIKVDESSKDIAPDDPWNRALIAGLAAGVVGALMLCALAVLICRRRKRRTRAEEIFDRTPIRIVNPSKKNSLNRRNDPGAAMRFDKLRMLEKGDEEEDDEEEEMGSMSEKCNLNNISNMEMRDFLKVDAMACRNLRPESTEISIEEEKAAVLEEMRKVSESSDD